MNLTFEQFEKLAERYNIIPLYDELPADLDTPVSAYLKIKEGDYGFLFESVVGGEKWARYSFLGTKPYKIYQCKDSQIQITDAENRLLKTIPFQENPFFCFREIYDEWKVYEDPDLPRFFGGFVGYFGYDIISYFEKIDFSDLKKDSFPDFYLMLTESLVVFDNLKQVMKVVCPVFLESGQDLKKAYEQAKQRIETIQTKLSSPLPKQNEMPVGLEQAKVQEALSKDEFCQIVEKAKDYIEAGDIFQVVLSNRFEINVDDLDPFWVYRKLRRINPSPYMYYLKLNDISVVGASPEILVRLEEDQVIVRPIAGTRKRGKTEIDDLNLEKELLQDPKEVAEHIMLVDLGRNDVGRVSQVGTVHVDEEKVIERYSHVMHIVSQVSGLLHPQYDVFDVLVAAFPAGTLSGAPKIRAMEIIAELEKTARGIYGGAIGYLGLNKNMDLAIAIRTAVFHKNKAIVQAGAGIVYNSIPENEYQECLNKAKGMIAAIQAND